MKQFICTDGKNDFMINLPTSLDEITKEYLTGVTANIEVAPYHAIVATIYRCKLPAIISTKKKSREMAVAIVPVFVRACVTDKVELETKALYDSIVPGDRLIIAGTDLERGYQLSVPKNFITIDNIIRIYEHDNNFAKGVMVDQNYYYFVDFKLVPITDIKGFYKLNFPADFINPFVAITKRDGEEVKVN